jgi:hypothetical protein
MRLNLQKETAKAKPPTVGMTTEAWSLASWAIFGKLTSIEAQFHQALARVHDIATEAFFGNV